MAELSIQALVYVDALGIDRPERIAARLYAFNRIPLTAFWRRLVPDRDAVLDLLGLAGSCPLRTRLEHEWRRTRTSATGWLGWENRKADDEPGEVANRYKLYFSPRVEDLPKAFPVLLEALSRGRALAFKVGADAAGLLRPDKIVAYFADRRGFEVAARDLARRSTDLTAHGVPFTSEIDHAGLLSWGVDSLGRDDPPELRELGWRGWVTTRLAVALIAAREKGNGSASVREVALESLRSEGVDVDRWAPVALVGP